ncbi:Glucose-6-phosphate isomerase [Frankliniella fusca]|uniref:Glucose-6-phosphate isomerase n=1 Tax=Frankliniella fusca TaxID=407009 RepID=A0AAE1HH89_9NEOP|nr:Glucose-6-phosphate isomerase [Frankliniella fusca]
MFTSATSFLVGMCTKKRHQLIRVHHAVSLAAAEGGASGAAGARVGGQEDTLAAAAATVTAVTGPDGLIQPYVEGGLPAEVAARYKTQGPQGTATVIFRGPDSLGAETEGEAEADVDGVATEAVAGPLEPAYPPIQPVTIVHGPLPEGGYRQTETYTELVLPPAYMDAHPSHKHLH